MALAARIMSHSELGYRILGFVDKEWEGREEASRAGYTILSDIVGFQQYLRTHIVDEVIMALPFRSMHDEALRIAAVCEEQGVTIRVLPNLFELKRAFPSAEELAEVPVLTLSSGSKEGWPIVAKRIIDITISSISLILLCPLMLGVIALVKLTSPGPALFAQTRVGLNKRPFRLLKFRTMVADAEERIKEVEHLNEASGPVFKIRHDPRLTPVGRFLRRTSIDELPQLVNVLLGDMSLVGPRPLPDRDYKGFSEDWQRRRFSVQPGITCLWQIGGRSSIPFDKWMELDLQYIDKWSLRLDAEILLRTIPAVLRGSGAA
jgi:exopolysaccharide biosynthesis polyprenyl glycosylphosphotransferase